MSYQLSRLRRSGQLSAAGGVFWGLVPLIFWTGPFGSTMNLGGDDSHLIYADPTAWFENVALSPFGFGLSSYNPQVFSAPMALALRIVDASPFNTQGIAFGITLALAFMGAARVITFLLRDTNARADLCGVVGGTVYVGAPILAANDWTHLLAPIYWQALAPWLIVLVLRHQETGRLRYALVASLSLAVASVAIASVPSTVAYLIVLVPLIALALMVHGRRPSFRRIVLFSAIVISVNTVWLLPLGMAPFMGQVQASAALSAEGRSGAVSTVRAVAPLMSPADSLSLRMSQQVMEKFNWAQQVPYMWTEHWGLLVYVPVCLIPLGLLTARKQHRRLLIGLILLSAALFFLVTVNIHSYGVLTFEFLVTRVPGWSVLRNFYDKFSGPYCLVIGITVGVASYQVLALLRRATARHSAALGLLALQVTLALPFIRGDYFRLPYRLGWTQDRVLSGIPEDYRNLVAQLHYLPPGNVVSVPLSGPAWTTIPQGSRHAYIGVSPVFVYSGRTDFNGAQAFTNTAAPYLPDLVRQYWERRDLWAVKELLGIAGVRYAVVNTELSSSLEFRDLRLTPEWTSEASDFARALAPRLLAKEGSWELRELVASDIGPLAIRNFAVPSSDDRQLLSLRPPRRLTRSERCSAVSPHLASYGRSSYRARLWWSGSDCQLILSHAFDPHWQATIKTRDSHIRLKSSRALGFVNSFKLPPSDGASSHIVEIDYGPSSLIKLGGVVSIISIVVIASCVLIRRVRIDAAKTRRLNRKPG